MLAPPAADPRRRVLVACLGNPLRGDDGFGLTVWAALEGGLPAGVDLIETGIGGLGILHELMYGYAGLIVVDAVDRGAPPGTVLVLVPEVPEVTEPTLEEWHQQVADLHLAEPSRVLRLARALGALPDHVLVVGCQPQMCEEFGEGLSRRLPPLFRSQHTESVNSSTSFWRRRLEDRLRPAVERIGLRSEACG